MPIRISDIKFWGKEDIQGKSFKPCHHPLNAIVSNQSYNEGHGGFRKYRRYACIGCSTSKEITGKIHTPDYKEFSCKPDIDISDVPYFYRLNYFKNMQDDFLFLKEQFGDEELAALMLYDMYQRNQPVFPKESVQDCGIRHILKKVPKKKDA